MNIGYLNEYDSIRYKQSGKFYEGTITKVVNNDFPFIEAKVYETTSYSKRLDKKPFTGIIYAESFEGLDMEFWFYGQGCDNSAIGVSGHWDKLVA